MPDGLEEDAPLIPKDSLGDAPLIPKEQLGDAPLLPKAALKDPNALSVQDTPLNQMLAGVRASHSGAGFANAMDAVGQAVTASGAGGLSDSFWGAIDTGMKKGLRPVLVPLNDFAQQRDNPVKSPVDPWNPPIFKSIWAGLHSDPTLDDPNAAQTGVPTPSPGDVISKFLPSAEKDIYEPLTGDKSGTMFEQNPDDPNNPTVKWGSLGAQGVDFVARNAVLSKLPPFPQLHNGPTPAAVLDQAARTEAVSNLGEGMKPNAAAQEFSAQTGKPAPATIYDAGNWTPEQAADFANPKLSTRVGAGTASAFGVQIPPKLAPLFTPLDPLMKALNYSINVFQGPEPRSPFQVQQKVNEGRALSVAQDVIRQNVMPIEAELARSGLPDEAVPHIKNFTELFTKDNEPRTFDAEGNPLPGNLPKRYADQFLQLADERPDVYLKAKEAYDSGAQHLSPQGVAAQEYASTLPDGQDYAFASVAKKTAALPEQVRQALIRAGTRAADIPELNGDIHDMPGKLFDLIDAIKAREEQTPVLKPDGLSKADGKVRALYDAVTGDTFDVPTLTKTIDDVRQAKKPVAGTEEPGKFSMTPETPPEPLGVQSIADAVNRKRSLASGNTAGALEPPDSFAFLEQLSRKELNDLKNSAYEKITPAMKQVGAVSNYVPGRLSQLSKMELDENSTPNLRPGKGVNPETTERGGLLADKGKQYDDMGNVKQSTYEINQSAEKGNKTNQGRSSIQPKSWYDKFLTATGIRDAQLAAGKTYMSSDALKLFRNDLEYMLPKAMSNAGIDLHILRTMQFEDMDRIRAMQQLFYDGVETGEKGDKALPNYYHTKPGALEAEATGKNQANPYSRPNVETPKVAPEPQSPFDAQDPFQRRTDPFAPPRTPKPAANFDFETPYDEEPLRPERGWFNEPREGTGTPGKPWEAPSFTERPTPRRWSGDPLSENPASLEFNGPRPFEGTNEPAKFAAPVEEVPHTRPPTLEEAQALWKKLGGKTDFLDRMNQEAKDRMAAGAAFGDVVDKKWKPDNMAEVQLGDKHGYIHAGVARDLEVYKRMGQDTVGIARFMNQAAPGYVATLSASRQMSTLMGPQFPAYMLLKQIHDQFRAYIGNLTDGQYPGEVWNGQKGWLQYAKTGSIDALPDYQGPNGQVISGADMAKMMEESGQTHAGTEYADYERQQADAQGRTQDQGFIAGRVQKLKDALSLNGDREVSQNLKATIQGQDYANRAAGMAARLRAGDSPMEAGFRANKAFFDFTRKGPATQVLAATGLVPFMAWHAKVIPFMLNWMVEQPGQFFLVQHALQQLGDGQMPASQLPDYLRDKTNMVIKVTKDDEGHYQVTMANDSGVIPGDDVKSLASSLAKNYGFQWLLQHAGPVPRAVLAIRDQIAESAKDPDKKTPEDVLGGIAKNNMFSRPFKAVDDLTQPTAAGTPSAKDVFNTLANPMHAGTLDMTRAGQFSVRNAEDNVKKSAFAVAAASTAVDKAKADVHAANVNFSEAQILQSDLVQKYAAQLDQAKQRLQSTLSTQQKVQSDNQRMNVWLERMSRVK